MRACRRHEAIDFHVWRSGVGEFRRELSFRSSMLYLRYGILLFFLLYFTMNEDVVPW